LPVVVAGVVVVEVVGVVVVWVLVELVVGVVLVGVVVVWVLVELVVGVLVVARWQSCAASWLTVEAPWVRFWRRFGLIVEGRLETSSAKLRLALCAVAQSLDETAAETWSSLLLRLFAWSPESSPRPPPQAAMTKDVAKPSPPATSARGT
jgi:hypothetical protein